MAPSSEAPSKIRTFARIFAFEYGKVPCALYRCEVTGLRIALAQVQSPTVHGYFTLDTEAFDDYGCPHTLEHLVFMGSERYPYKGALDVLANRCLAQGTNAWTDVDHTCYTVDTAGCEGFLRLLPVFLDHVLFPTLKDSAFVTEVHHINGEGANAGVVYCEMQARENQAGDMVERATKLAAYPGRCSYKSETGGRLKELRELTNATVRDYHKAYYRPENLCVIVTGLVGFGELCEAVAPVVTSIQQNDAIKALPPFQRPFASAVPCPESPVVVQMEFPAEDEKTGAVVKFAWHGPTWVQQDETVALKVLFSYLTQDSISPLQRAFVETAPPLCGKVSHTMYEQSTYLLCLSLKDAVVEQLEQRDVDAELTAVLQTVAAVGGGGVDCSRMQSLIRQQRRQHLSSLEGDPHELFGGEIIGAFLYAPGFAPDAVPGPEVGADLRMKLDLPGRLDELLDWPAARWAELCARWLLGPTSSPRVTVIGKPSKSCGEKIQSEDKTRIEKQTEHLGEEGIKAAAKLLADAEEENDVETPDEVAAQFQLPDVSKVGLIDVSTVKVHGSAGPIEAVFGGKTAQLQALLENAKHIAAVPDLTAQFDHVPGAQFVSCHLMVPLASLTQHQLALLPLWCDAAFELPLQESAAGPAMTFEEVVKSLTDLAVNKGFSVGVGGGRFSIGTAGNMLDLVLKVENTRYVDAASWLTRLLFDVNFDAERLRIAAKRIANDVPNMKRSSQSMLRMMGSALNYNDGSAEGAFNAFRLERVLMDLANREGAFEQLVVELASMRSTLLNATSSMFVRIGGDIEGLGADIFGPWSRLMASDGAASAAGPRVPEFARPRDMFAVDALRPPAGCTSGCLLSSSTDESNYWVIMSASLTDPRSPELAPLLVAAEYLTALEGPFWRKIRGKGLSYSYSLQHSLEKGSMSFGLFKATDPIAAYIVAQEIVKKLCGVSEAAEAAEGAEAAEDGEDDSGLDPTALEAAQSGMLFNLIEGVDTIPVAMGEAFSNTLQRLAPDQLQWLLAEVQNVTIESVAAAMRTHILPLFDGTCGRVVSLTCPAEKKDKIQAGLRTLSPPFHVAHCDVETLVSTLSPDDGFAKLRRMVLTAQEAAA